MTKTEQVGQNKIGTRLSLGLPDWYSTLKPTIKLGKNIGIRLKLNLPPLEPILVSDNSKPKVFVMTKNSRRK